MRKRMMHEFELSCGLVKLNDGSMVDRRVFEMYV